MAKKNRVAIIGTSLISTEVAEIFLSRGSDITFFENSSLGGAWGSRRVGTSMVSAPRFNNLLFPYSHTQQRLLEEYAEKFKRLRLAVAEGPLELISSETYQPSKILVGDFSSAILRTVSRDGTSIVSKPAKQIEVNANFAVVNGRSFDYVVLPQNAPVPSIKFCGHTGTALDGYSSRPPFWESNRSEHIRLLFNKEQVQHIPLYKEGGDPVFDRFGSLPVGPGCFIGRVRREFKGNPAMKLLAISPLTAPLISKTSIHDTQTFSQARLVPSVVERLKQISTGTKVLDGVDFLTGMEGAHIRINAI